jgi:small subunit ribosomal protein S20
MANHASAEKRNRQRIVRTTRNRAVRSALRSRVRAARAALEAATQSGSKEEALAAAQVAKIALAKAAGKGVIHRNTAARSKSRLDKALAQLS